MKSKNTTLPPKGFGGKLPPELAGAGKSITLPPELKLVDLTSIAADPNQPRKHFDKVSGAELFESVRSQGILQPVLLRWASDSELYSAGHATKDLYLVVCGERRFRASLAVMEEFPDRNKIPAIIRHMTDDEAIEAQIVENLQRRDVHPMEEALAFAMLAKRGLTQEQIGARVGKGDRFVRARLVLCNLIKAWQDLFMRGAFDLETAVKVARFTDVVQKEVLKEQELTKEELAKPDLKITLKDFSSYQGDLLTACFDLADPTLNPKMGPCTTCPFNSANGVLFTDDTTRPRCQNLPCYKLKSERGLELKIEEAKTNPEIFLVKEGYRAESDLYVQKLEKDGLTILGYNDYEQADTDEDENPGTYAEWKRKSLAGDWMGEDYDEDEDEKSNRAVYADLVKDYENSQNKLQKGIESGKYKKALVVQGQNNARGSVIWIELAQKKYQNGVVRETPAQKVATGKATAQDLSAEILRLEQDIENTKKKAIDSAHAALVAAYKSHPATISKTDKELTGNELICLTYFLIEMLSRGVEDLHEWLTDPTEEQNTPEAMFAKALGIQPPAGKKAGKDGAYSCKDITDFDPGEPDGQDRVWKFLSGLNENQLALIFRRVLANRYGQPNMMNDREWILRKMAQETDIDIAAIEKAENEKAEKRITRAAARIAQLKEQKQELEGKKKKKAAPKAKAEKVAPAAESATPPLPIDLHNLTAEEKKATGWSAKKLKTDAGIAEISEKLTKYRAFKQTQLPPEHIPVTEPEAREIVVKGGGKAAKKATSRKNQPAIEGPAAAVSKTLDEDSKLIFIKTFENKAPGADFALAAARITDHNATDHLIEVVDGFPESDYKDYFKDKLLKGNEKDRLAIVTSWEFVAILRTNQRALDQAEIAATGHEFPHMAADTNPEVARDIIEKLVAFWKKKGKKELTLSN